MLTRLGQRLLAYQYTSISDTALPYAAQITDVGGLALSRAAKAALVLSRLNISLNSITDATLHALAEALRFNTGTLKEVAAAGARADEDAAITLIRAATKNNSLQLLDIRGVPLEQDVRTDGAGHA